MARTQCHNIHGLLWTALHDDDNDDDDGDDDGDDKDGVFLTCEDFEGRFNNSFPACASVFFSLKWRSARMHQFYYLGQDQCTVAQ